MTMTHPSDRHYLSPLFEPAAVAVIGASDQPGSVGEVLVRNILAAGYAGELFAVNPRHETVQGIRCYPNIADVPRRVDLAVIATPAATVPDLIAQCGNAGVHAAVVITAWPCWSPAAM